MVNYSYVLESGKEMSFVVKSIPTKYLKTLYKVFNKFNALEAKNKGLSDEDKSVEMMEMLSTDLMDDLILVSSVTVKRSNPSWSDDEVDEFVGNHYLKLLPLVAEVNFPK